MAKSYHGTSEQALEWVLNVNRDGQVDVFLTAWLQGTAEDEWPEFYAWLETQPERMDPSDLHVAIGKDAFDAGWEAALSWVDAGRTPDGATGAREQAWSEYTPPEELCGHG